jgi:hypothetical protein
LELVKSWNAEWKTNCKIWRMTLLWRGHSLAIHLSAIFLTAE